MDNLFLLLNHTHIFLIILILNTALFIGHCIFVIMIWVSFFKPMGIFEGSFNKFAAWWTAGEYCHCELVFEIQPQVLMTSVKHVYGKMTNTNENHQKVCAELESVFFEDKQNKKILQTNNKIYLSFSLIWGDQLRVRFLTNIEDPWMSSPEIRFEDITWVKCNPIDEEKEKKQLEWALSQVTKPYNSSAALFSWVPALVNDDINERPSYFCSEFASLSLVRMEYLEPLATHRCTPNHLADILEKKQRIVLDTPKRTEISLIENKTPEPTYVSSSDDEDIQLLEEEIKNIK
jgi:hypothetical protein